MRIDCNLWTFQERAEDQTARAKQMSALNFFPRDPFVLQCRNACAQSYSTQGWPHALPTFSHLLLTAMHLSLFPHLRAGPMHCRASSVHLSYLFLTANLLALTPPCHAPTILTSPQGWPHALPRVFCASLLFVPHCCFSRTHSSLPWIYHSFLTSGLAPCTARHPLPCGGSEGLDQQAGRAATRSTQFGRSGARRRSHLGCTICADTLLVATR
eukprot:1149900-Pelagomonas_calceolata.AAC.4